MIYCNKKCKYQQDGYCNLNLCNQISLSSSVTDDCVYFDALEQENKVPDEDGKIHRL